MDVAGRARIVAVGFGSREMGLCENKYQENNKGGGRNRMVSRNIIHIISLVLPFASLVCCFPEQTVVKAC